MRLATPAEVLAAAGIISGSGTLASAGAALDITFSSVEGRLESPLGRAERIDYFDLTASDTKSPTLRLEAGFLSKDDSITVTANGTVLGSDQIKVQYDLGTIRILGTFTKGENAVVVHYTAGFEKDQDGVLKTTNYEALKHGGIATAAAFLLTNPAHSPKDKAAYLARVSLNALDFKVRQSLAPFTRPRGSVIWATSSETVE